LILSAPTRTAAAQGLAAVLRGVAGTVRLIDPRAA
jgi:hypothetical protein